MIKYICGYNDENRSLHRMVESQWKEKHDYFIRNGIKGPICRFKQGSNAISELDNDMYKKENPELRLVELFKE